MCFFYYASLLQPSASSSKQSHMSLCNEKDKQALLNFKQGLSDPSKLLSSWSDQEDCSRWGGVSYDNKTGRVTELDLSLSSLGGEIRGSLLQLEHLNYLDLSMNDFNRTPIPTFLGSMASLTHLDLSLSHFSGRIPHQLGNLSNLRYLNLGFNHYLYADNLHWMSYLSSIQYLDFSSVDLHKEVDWLQIMSMFPSLLTLIAADCELGNLNPSLGFVNFTSLRHLDLSFNQLDNLNPTLGSVNFPSLRSLDLSNNPLDNPNPSLGFVNFTSLQYLDLSYSKLLKEVGWLQIMSMFPSLLTLIVADCELGNLNPSLGFVNFTSLRHLDLSFNQLDNLNPTLGSVNFPSLRHLDLSNNPLDNPNPSLGFVNFTSLQYLDLSYSKLLKEVDWLQIISMFPSLSALHASNCELVNLNPPLGFVNFTSLQYLDLSDNLFSHEIPNWFSNLTASLLHLDLSNNSLRGEIPPSIFNSPKLEYLDLYHNKLIGKIPESLGQLKHLTYLDMKGNSFSGPIPSSIGNLSYLETLMLSDNQLNGTIPKTLGLLSNLQTLYVGNNFLTGTVDEEHFTKLSKLEFLSISDTPLFFNVNSNWASPFQLINIFMSSCKIGPNFPTWLQTQRSVEYLDLSKSEIADKAPGWFWNWTSNIERIDLSDNQIEGYVSDIVLNSFIINLRSNHFKGQMPRLSTNVKELHIANNSFSGPISSFMCQKMNRKNQLMVLDVSNNLLTGALPHCWKYWQSLTHLHLGSNDISGRIPYSMGSLVALQSLHLQSNRISGDIPSSLKKCSNLSLIDIGENLLLGAIPPWIGEMTNLIILRLSSNGFKGHIPLQICQLSSLIVLDLANNSLSRHIPNCLKNISAMTIPTPGFEARYSFKFLCGGLLCGDTYLEKLKLVPKGVELEYEENLGFVKIIDLSSNNLSGSIPSEISILSGLCFLNLSQNQLIGKIPEKIEIMKKLESIDLSQNHLSSEIPSSLSSLTFLSHLNLSYNNLSGKIPLGPQLQTFDAHSYIGNPQLCGNPLPRNCTIGEESQNRTPIEETKEDSNNSNFYIGMGVGFAVGFWAVCGVLFFNRTWRHAYFKFFDDMKDWVYVTTMLNVNWLLEKRRSYDL